MVKGNEMKEAKGLIGLGILPIQEFGKFGIINKLQTEGRILNTPNINAMKNSFVTGLGFFSGARVVDRVFDALMRLRI